MMRTFKIIPPGTRVNLHGNEGVICSVNIKDSTQLPRTKIALSVSYEISWWNGNALCSGWFPASQFTVLDKDKDGTTNIGFIRPSFPPKK